MDITILLDKIKSLHAKFNLDHPDLGGDPKIQVLARSAKVTEELGELNDEILSSLSLQRTSKLNNHSKASLAKEYSDTLISILLLGISLKLNIPQELSKRLDQKYDQVMNSLDYQPTNNNRQGDST